MENKKITAWYGDPNFKFDGSNGEVLTRIPEFYYKHEVIGDDEYYYITKFKTDEYIKSLENYIRDNDPSVRKAGIIDLIKRYEEDSSRYDDPALTALLNIALQDPKAENRMLAMSVISAEQAHGDENTIALLRNLQTSTKAYNQERKMAMEAALKAAQSKVEVVDNDPPKYKSEDK